MYGYIRPDRPELRVRELERYKAAYCGLCHALGARYGFIARFFVSYDLTLVSMLASNFPDACEGELCRKRCPASPFKKKQCMRGAEGESLAADISIISAWWKIADDAEDEKWYKKPLYALARLAARGKYKKAAAARPRLAEATESCVRELHELERGGCTSLDRLADCFGRQMRAVADELPQHYAPATGPILYHLARAVYILDAVDDAEDDAKNGAFNAVTARFGTVDAEAREKLRFTVTRSLAESYDSFGLLPAGPYTELLDNILGRGMIAAADRVLNAKNNDLENK